MNATVIKIRQIKAGWWLGCLSCGKEHVEDTVARAIVRARKHGKRCSGASKVLCNCHVCRHIRRLDAEDLIRQSNSVIVIYR